MKREFEFKKVSTTNTRTRYRKLLFSNLKKNIFKKLKNETRQQKTV